jgi:hypothetical protein
MKKIIINSNNINKDINIEKKIKELQYKLLTYIDLYNIKYTDIYETDEDEDNDKYVYLEKYNNEMNNKINNEMNNKINNKMNNQTNLIQTTDNKINNINSKQNIKYEPHIKYCNILLEKIGNINILYKNYNNVNKKIANYLIFSIRKNHICNLLEHLYYLLDLKGYQFNFINYDYELYNINGVDNMYLIQKKLKGLTINFMKPCVLFIFIRDKLFIHNY